MKTIIEYLINNHVKKANNLEELSHEDADYLEGEALVIYVAEQDENGKDIAYYIIDEGDEAIGEPFGQKTYDYDAVSQDMDGRTNSKSKGVLNYLSQQTGLDTKDFWVTYCMSSSLWADIQGNKDVKIYRLIK